MRSCRNCLCHHQDEVHLHVVINFTIKTNCTVVLGYKATLHSKENDEQAKVNAINSCERNKVHRTQGLCVEDGSSR